MREGFDGKQTLHFLPPSLFLDVTMTKLSHFDAVIMELWFTEHNHFSWKQLESQQVGRMRGLMFESTSSGIAESVDVNACDASIFNYRWGKIRGKTL